MAVERRWVLVLFGFLFGSPWLARADWQETFESEKPTWAFLDSDCKARVLDQRRVFDKAHAGLSSERIRFAASTGSSVVFAHDSPTAPVIDEVQPSLWVLSERAGVQLLARIVLPRSRDPRTDRPLTVRVHGTSYAQTGNWQRLTIPDLRKQLRHQVQRMRSQYGRKIDEAEAYLDRIELNAYTIPGTTEIWLDDLEIEGPVAVQPEQGHDKALPAARVSFNADAEPESSEVRLHGGRLMVDGRPISVRAIEWNGETFEFLQSLGFNTIKMPITPHPAQLEEARRLNLWLIAPPPQLVSGNTYSRGYGRILAWSLGRNLRAEDIRGTRQLREEVQLADPLGRPQLCGTSVELEQFSHHADIVLLEQTPLASTLDLSSYGLWIEQARQTMRLGTPCWATVPTQWPDAVVEQTLLLTADGSSREVDPQQIRLIAMNALAAGARGLNFTSRTRLDDADPVSTARAALLRWINAELSLVEPWAAAGEPADKIVTNSPDVVARVLRTERARLAIVLRNGASQQFVLGPPQREQVQLQYLSAPSTDEPLRIRWAGLQKLPRQSGSRIMLDNAGPVTLLLMMSEDEQVRTFVSQRLAAAAHASLGTWQESLGRAADRMAAAGRDLPPPDDPRVAPDKALALVRSHLDRSRQLLGSRDAVGAEQFAQLSENQLARLRRSHWDALVKGLPSPSSLPLLVSPETLVLHREFAQQARAVRWSGNSLAAGDFEDLEQLRGRGWQHRQTTDELVRASAELSFDSPHAGRRCLRLIASPADPRQSPSLLASPPIQITSAPVPVRRGQWIRVHGWVQIPRRLSGSVDGLQIIDSAGTVVLAERIHESPQWREFAMIRAATRDEPFTVTFSLTGYGEARLDDISVSLADSPKFVD